MASIKPVLTSVNAFNLDIDASSVVRCTRRGSFITAPICTGDGTITRGCNLFAISKHPNDEVGGISDEPAFDGFPEIGFIYVKIGGGVFRFRAPAECFTPTQAGSPVLKLDLPKFPVTICISNSYWLPNDCAIARDSSAMGGFVLEISMTGGLDLSDGDIQASTTVTAVNDIGERYALLAEVSIDLEGIWVK